MNAAPVVAASRTDLAAARGAYSGRVAVVMTMGALHHGHAALLRAAQAQAETVIVTIFVNPLQFDSDEDLAHYPSSLGADLTLCREIGVDLVFIPSEQEIYPFGRPVVQIDPGQLGTVLEGASRPGHFPGVLTVVLKLLQLTRPEVAFFGEKDYQQLVLVRAMVRDLDLPVRVASVPTVRESDGLACSSRNRRLTSSQRGAARSLSAGLRAGATAARHHAGPAAVLQAARAAVAGVELDYLALTDPELRPLAEPIGTDASPLAEIPADGVARLLIAARVGDTRLIDNAEIMLPRGSG